MKFLLDENLPLEFIHILKKAGHSATTVIKQDRGGATDEELITFCRRERLALVTLDMDFSDIRRYPPSNYAGIIVLKLSNQSKKSILNLSKKFIPLLKTEPLEGQLWIVDENRIRIREKAD